MGYDITAVSVEKFTRSIIQQRGWRPHLAVEVQQSFPPPCVLSLRWVSASDSLLKLFQSKSERDSELILVLERA